MKRVRQRPIHRVRVLLAAMLFVSAGPLLAVDRAGDPIDGAARFDRILQFSAVEEGEYLTHAYFGTSGDNTVSLPAAVGVPGFLTAGNRGSDNGRIYCESSDCTIRFPVSLPAGAVITGLHGNINDSSSGGQVFVGLSFCAFDSDQFCNSPTGNSYFISSGESDTPGAAVLSTELDSSVYLGDYSLSVFVRLLGGTSAIAVKNVMLTWKRQISPAPASATFADVPSNNTFYREIEALAASGVTQGCSGSSFCPTQLVTRGQMAAFLARALGL